MNSVNLDIKTISLTHEADEKISTLVQIGDFIWCSDCELLLIPEEQEDHQNNDKLRRNNA